ncbi:MAG: hypothetical protein QOG82_1269 [Actinomycetota bacterium]|jgi:hypothetical protein|nr:hypothetical protein [Actinomycetota bacterium]
MLREMVSGFEPGALSGEAAVRVLELFGEVERLGAAGVALAAGRVEATRAWQGSGNRSAAHFVADRCGSSVRSAVVALETARRLESLPATDEALRSGKLSMAKANEIASTAGDRPEKEAELVAAADAETLPALQEKCRAMRAEGTAGVEGYEQVRKSRFLRHWTDADGAFRIEARLCPDAGAKVLAALGVHQRRIFAGARREGRRESYEAYAADALVALADGDGGVKGPQPVVHVRVDHAALVRGHVEDGETCDIPGVGPIPVATARALATDGVLKVLVTKGVDVVAVAHGGRTVPAHLRSALETRDPKCVVPGCDVRDRLEIDHLVCFAEGGPTTLENLARLCHRHHALKTHQGWVLAGRPGAWTWDPPP